MIPAGYEFSASTVRAGSPRWRACRYYYYVERPVAMPAAAIRKSSRVRSAPQRLRPNSDLPAQMQDMIHEAAVSCAAKSAIKFEPAAVNALEEALEPIFQSIMEAAMVPSCSPSSCLVDELAATATAAVAAAAALLVAPAVVMSTTGALLVCLL